ncbi:hypothetical protein [Tistlia consotensis]|uniref:hypothetical protein n=1 Tax=Tistlia consotensis TaxID=1321365 RepID=UPI00135666EF|nr:hypothetical protein [Tistlia consotensis]
MAKAALARIAVLDQAVVEAVRLARPATVVPVALPWRVEAIRLEALGVLEVPVALGGQESVPSTEVAEEGAMVIRTPTVRRARVDFALLNGEVIFDGNLEYLNIHLS